MSAASERIRFELPAALRSTWTWIFAAVCVLKGISYYLFALWYHPTSSIAAIAMYREYGNDIEYFPAVRAVASGGLREMFNQELEGQTLLNLTWPSLIFHAVGLRLFGAWGFAVADVAVALTTFAILLWLFRRLGLSRALSGCLALLVVSEGLVKLVQPLPRLIYRIGLPEALVLYLTSPVFKVAAVGFCVIALLCVAWVVFFERKRPQPAVLLLALVAYLAAQALITPSFFDFWGWRLPRPGISSIYFFGGLATLLAVLQTPAQAANWRTWAAFGAFFGLLVQANLHEAFIVIVAGAGVFGWLIATSPVPLAGLIRNAAVSGAATLLSASYFLYQRMTEHPDLPRRNGAFSLDRLSFPHFLPEPIEVVELGLSAVIAALLVRWLADDSADSRSVLRRRGLGFVWFLVLASLIAWPVSVALAGKSIISGRFYTEFLQVLSLLVVVTTAFVVDRLADETMFASMRARVKPLVMAAVAMFSVWAISVDGRGPNFKVNAIRSDFKEWAVLPNYRRDIEALMVELEKPTYNRKVIGTFDLQVGSWWTTFRSGYLYLPDVFITSATDTEIEQRLMLLAKRIGMRTEDFEGFLKRPHIMMLFHSIVKYACSPLHCLAPLSDYTAEEQKRIASGSPLSVFALYLPGSEKSRIRAAYTQADPTRDTRALDFIVLTQDESLAGFGPDPRHFALVFENTTFRLWKRTL